MKAVFRFMAISLGVCYVVTEHPVFIVLGVASAFGWGWFSYDSDRRR